MLCKSFSNQLYGQASTFENNVMPHIASESKSKQKYVIEQLKQHPQKYEELSRKYDLLSLACRNGLQISLLVKYLLDQGVLITEEFIEGYSHTAMNQILKDFVHVNFKFNNGDTLLIYFMKQPVSEQNYYYQMLSLFEFGVDPFLTDAHGKDAYYYFNEVVDSYSLDSLWTIDELRDIAGLLYKDYPIPDVLDFKLNLISKDNK